MAVRALKLKLIVPRGDSADALRKRRSLWATHEFVNSAVAHYERLLLEMRQAPVCVGRDDKGKDLIEGADVWKGRLRERLKANGVSAKIMEEALVRLRTFYEQIVESSVKPNSGSSQGLGSEHGLLVDPTSLAGEQGSRQLELWEPVLKLIAAGRGYKREAEQVLREHEELLSPTGAPPAWLRRYKAKDPTWPDVLKTALEDLQAAEASAGAQARRWLKQKKVLPVLPPYSRGRVVGGKGQLNPAERMAFALAVAHLNAWESWCHRARQQHAERAAEVDSWMQRYGESHRKTREAIAVWESARANQLKAEAFWAEDSVYRLRPRELRGWDRLRDWLRDHPDASAEKRLERVHELQAELGREFGSEIALRWLAAPGQQWLAEHTAGDVVSRVALLNVRLGILERTREHPLCTLAEARLHPRYAEFDPPANTNNPGYDLATRDGVTYLILELLAPGDEGLSRETFEFPLAPSGQFENGRVEADGKKRAAVFMAQDRLGEETANVGGGALIFDRSHMERASPAALAAGGLGDVFFKIALDRGGEEEKPFRARAKVRTWFSSAVKNRGTNGEQPKPGTKVLAVDLGLRSAASISVFEVVRGDFREGDDADRPVPPAKSLGVEHLRSAILRLPGEDPSAKERERREAETIALLAVRAGVTHLQTVRRLCVAVEPSDRREILDGLGGQRPGRIAPAVAMTPDERSLLAANADAQEARWKELAFPVYRRLETDLGLHIRSWRRESRARSSEAIGGKSAWAIEHLELTRKVLMRWHRHQRPMDTEVRRLDRSRQGTAASRLLEHINRLKEDRVKTTADLVVQAARGVVYRDGIWEKRHDPVDLIVMEDLSRYRFRTDRPRAENSQLMRWSHREIRAAVEMQAEVYGIPVADTGAAFSSQYDAVTRAPGVRCVAYDRDLAERLARGEAPRVASQLEKLGVDAAKLHPGDLLPIGGGEQLASLLGPKRLRVRHADVNAAQNIAKRFLDGHIVPVRLTAFALKLPDGSTVYVNKALGKRAESAFGGSVAVLRPLSDSEVQYEVKAFKNELAAARALGLGRSLSVSEEREATSELEDEDLELAAAREQELELAGERKTFFRDPSRCIHCGRWVEAKIFWGAVRTEVTKRLKAEERLHG